MIYKYNVVRSARRSVSVEIAFDNTITVRCPWDMSVKKVEEFVESKSAWIEKTVSENCRKLAVNDDVVEGRQIYVYGQRFEYVYGDKNLIEDGVLTVIDQDYLPELFVNTFKTEFMQRLESYSQKLLLKAKSVSFKDYGSRWGCCDASNNLIFNYKLFMLPERLQDYIIVHELCHTLCHNHSHAFWLLVGQGIPDYKTRKEELKYYDFLVGLY